MTHKFDWLNDIETDVIPLDDHQVVFIRKSFNSKEIRAPSRHPHSCEFNVLFEGECQWHIQEGTIHRKPGSVGFIAPDIPHVGEAVSEEVLAYAVFFRPETLIRAVGLEAGSPLLHRFTDPQPVQQRVPQAPARLQKELRERLKRMEQEQAKQETGWSVRMMAELMNCLVSVARWENTRKPANQHARPHEDWPALEKAINYIRGHQGEKIYAHDLADACGVCETTLRTVFRERMGMTWTHYVQQVRVTEAAARLISHPEKTIVEIAGDSGFHDLSHFNRVFRKETGLSPSAYRKTIRKKPQSK